MLTKSILLMTCLFVSACGVKGRPLPPLNPAPIGRGEPVFKDSKKENKKTTIPSLEEKSGN